MDLISVHTGLLEQCAVSIANCSNDASDLAREISSVLSSMPENCKDKFGSAVKSYQKEMASISGALQDLQSRVTKVQLSFEDCENEIKRKFVDDGEGSSNANESSIWDSWPFTWVDGALDWLNIGKYDRDYVDPGLEKQQEHDELMRTQFRDLLSSDRFSEETWDSASTEERKKILNEFLREVNKIYGTNITKDINFYYKEPSNNLISNGYYTDSKRRVSVNEYVLERSSRDKLMNLILHEMRHAYQREVVRHPDQYAVSEENARAWEYNFDHYKKAEDGYSDYYNQPVEADAFGYADSVV